MLEAISIVFVEVHGRQQIPYSSFSGSRLLKDALSTLVASQDRHQICKRYPISMSVVHFLAEREPRMPQLRQKAPLLATLLCLERRGHKWPDQEFFEYAKAEAAPFPALVRWVQERIECWRAIQPDGDLEGYEDFSALTADDLHVLSAVGTDEEEACSAAYMKLARSLVAEGKYEEALLVCDTHLPLGSALVEEVVDLYLQAGVPSGAKDDVSHPDYECVERVRDTRACAQITLRKYKHWDVHTARASLSSCVQKLGDAEMETDTPLRAALNAAGEKISVFARLLTVGNLQGQLSTELAAKLAVSVDLEELSPEEVHQGLSRIRRIFLGSQKKI